MIADILLVILALAGLSISAVVDIKKREIPNWTNFSMIAAALAIRLMHSTLTLQWSYFLYGLLGFIIMLGVGNLMYYTKQWGGGDSKLLFAIGAIFATKPYFLKNFPVPFLLIMFLAIVLTGAAYSFVYGLSLAVLNRKTFLKRLLELNKTYRKTRSIIIFAAIILAVFGALMPSDLGLSVMGFSAVIIVSVYWILFAKAVESACLIKTIPLSKLTEGDWITNEKLRKKFKISTLGIENSQIEKLKTVKIKQIEVKYGIPFAPSFLIALIIILLI